MTTINVTTSQNLSAVSYAAGDTININDGVTLTITATPSVRPGVIQALGTGVCRVENASASTMLHLELEFIGGISALRFEQNAQLTTRGNWITVATGTGAANQTVMTTTAIGGASIDLPTKIQVETGSGTGVFEDWILIPEKVSDASYANTYGFNKPDSSGGTISVTAAGAVTGVGTSFDSANAPGQRIRIGSLTRDFAVSAVTSSTAATVTELDGTSYAGGAQSGVAYFIRDGALISRIQVGNEELGKVLWLDPIANTVKGGDGVNGNVIPSGARVRVPNIHITTRRFSTTTTSAISSTAATALTLASMGMSNGIPTTATVRTGLTSATDSGTLLLISGSTCERISYNSRSGTTVSATGMLRGDYGTTAQASWPSGTSVYYLPAATALGSATVDCDASGTVDFEVTSFGMGIALGMSNFASLRVKDIGAFGRFSASSSAGAYAVDGISVMSQSWQCPGSVTVPASMGGLIGPGYAKGILVSLLATSSRGATKMGFSLGTCQGATEISGIKSVFFNRNGAETGGTLRGAALSNLLSTTVVRDVKVVGCCLYLGTCSGTQVTGLGFANDPSPDYRATEGSTYPAYLTACSGVVVRGLYLPPGARATRSAPVLVDNGCVNCVVHNKGYPDIDGQGNMANLCNDSGQNTVVSHFTVLTPRAGSTTGPTAGNVITGRGGVKRRLRIPSITASTSGSGLPMKSGEVVDVVSGPWRQWSNVTTTAVCPNLVDVQPIVVMCDAAQSSGWLGVGPFSAAQALDMYDTSGAGDSYLDNLGRWYIQSSGVSLVIKSTYPLHAVTGFSGTLDYNYNLAGGTNPNPIPAGVTVEARMSGWGTPNTGAWGAVATTADLQTMFAALAGYSNSVGLDLQIRISTTTASAGRYLMNLRLPVTLDSAWDTSVGSTNITATNVVPGSLVALYNNTTPASPVLLGSSTSSGLTTLPAPYDFDDSLLAYRLVARKAGYTFANLLGTYNQTAVSAAVAQVQVLRSDGSANYQAGPFTGIAVDHGTQTVTLTESHTAREVWSYVQDHMCALANMHRTEFLTTVDGSSYTLTYNLVVSGCTLSGSAPVQMPTKTLTLTGGGAVEVTVTDLAGSRVFVTAPALVAGSRVQVYNQSTGTELYNGVLAADGLTLRATFTTNQIIRLRADKDTKLPLETVGILSAAGASFLDVQADDAVYTVNSIDGSTVTEFSADGANIQIDIDDADGVTSVQRLYAWLQWYQTTAAGVASPFFGAMAASDAANYVVNQALVNMQLDNVSTTPLRFVGGYLARKDGSTIIAPTSGSIQMDPGKAYVPTGSVTASVDSAAVATAVRTALAPELARVDVAVSSRMLAGAVVDADVKRVNGTTIKGSGIAGDTWGPA